jgi:hypothetical protein
MGLFSKLNDDETDVLVAKLISGNTAASRLHGSAQHEMRMEGWAVIGDVQESRKREDDE